MLYLISKVLLLLLLPWSSHESLLGKRDLVSLSAGSIATLVASPDPLKNLDPANPASHLAKILIPRAPQTDNNTFVRNYIISTLKKLDWHIEEDEFMGLTPVGMRRFTNVIATKDPQASRRVVLSAHFDSKYFANYPENQFLGATDSAAPCAMMLDLAESLNPLLDQRHERFDAGEEDDEDVADTTLQLIFFDGEEAFHDWTDTDSIYGSRHLAEKWASTYILPAQKRRLMGPQTTEISGIEHLILLDLLGAPQPTIRSFFTDTAWLFDAMADVEQRLGDSGQFAYGNEKSMASDRWRSYFLPRTGMGHNLGYVGDDHVPFLKRGVSILHLIAEPFPSVWHTLRDDASALDLPTMRRWNLILRVFMSEYLNLRPSESVTRSGGDSEEGSDLKRMMDGIITTSL
ncbi:glutaminyl-peptide cyclotransferase-like protein [Mycena floridula]|nr:glutaminyl-peptide cyclotransferase-like protein [Mycena floridula]